MMAGTEKVFWSGRLVGVLPSIRLLRSFDEREHSYQEYVLRVNGTCGDQAGEFLIAVGQGAHEKHRFPIGLSAAVLGDSDYYEFVLDAVQALCRKAKVYPCLLDAAIFASFDKGGWTEETVVW